MPNEIRKVVRVGNSLGIVIPKKVVDDWGVLEKSRVIMIVDGNDLIIKKVFDATEVDLFGDKG